MPDTDPPTTPPQTKPLMLGYETTEHLPPPGKRPAWVYVIFAIYGLLALALLTSPAWLAKLLDEKIFIQASICVSCVTAAGASLMILPVRVARRRTITRKSIWIPLIGSGFLAGSLVAGAGMALCEYLKADNNNASLPAIAIGAVVVWAAWGLFFWLIVFSDNPQSLGMKLHRALIVGSVMELLVAVPTHIVVRRRPECCAGYMTGMGICIGVVVMFVSFGPSVLLLFYRRRKQITRK
jgi:hypothetical protein